MEVRGSINCSVAGFTRSIRASEMILCSWRRLRHTGRLKESRTSVSSQLEQCSNNVPALIPAGDLVVFHPSLPHDS